MERGPFGNPSMVATLRGKVCDDFLSLSPDPRGFLQMDLRAAHVAKCVPNVEADSPAEKP